ncbi:baseplate J/gp47 family protein [Dechloromonas denitrificans]|uniref:baseplate assembly protein n=1 Tax=Dechloromonas denitrificans TaxID=281362 RepID=UPI001CF925EB|nr:baseplate J/gp47 family protein [Dechloromonas denitrificans]UCV02304.1 baseplate J/gp47 family protein [Dechloromonas denitrificans]
MTIDLASLPAPEVVESLAFETILAEAKADFVERYPDAAATIDLESDPVVKLLETFAYRELLLRARYNDEARALLLAFATGADLDHIGITYYNGTERLVVTPADDTTIPPTPAVMETHTDYRTRLQLQPESESVAGPRDAYRFHAISASGQVKDAQAIRPESSTVQIFVLSRLGNGVADAGLLATVGNAVTPEDIRPMCDEVVVSSAAIVEYVLDVDLILFSGPSGEVVIPAAEAALAAFAAENHLLGNDIVDSAIKAAAHIPGVKKVIINSPPADVVCTPGQAPYCTAISVNVTAVE